MRFPAGRGGSSGAGAAGDGQGGASGNAGGGGATACSPPCDATQACVGGRCLLGDGQPCVAAAQCASGACNPFYKDVDSDGYGTGQAAGFCSLTGPPIGYAAQNGDCCDDAANIALAKLIHPGADFQPTSAGGICGGITWDYDCDGMIESDPQTIACNSDYPSCSTYKTASYLESQCGGVQAGCGCSPVAGLCQMTCASHPGTVACK